MSRLPRENEADVIEAFADDVNHNAYIKDVVSSMRSLK
jgi:hypothetical protein